MSGAGGTLPGVHLIQISETAWLVVDEMVKPRFLIVNGPLVHRETGETHLVHRVEWWSIDPKKRTVLAVCDGLLAARTWCREEMKREVERKAEDSARLSPRTLPR